MENFKISIITVVYNDEERIVQTLKSVAGQTYVNLEYIIVDGLSKDNTLNVINNSNIKVDKLITEKDKGIYDAMNKGVLNCTGDWVLFLNAGDTFYSENTLTEIFNFDNLKEFDIIYGRHMWDYVTFKKESIKRPLELMNKTMPFCHQATFTKREWLRKYPFDLSYSLIADYDFFRKIYYDGAKFFYTPVIIANYLTTGGASSNNLIKVYKENFQITKDINIIIRLFWLFKKVFMYYLSQFIKFLLPKAVIDNIKKKI